MASETNTSQKTLRYLFHLFVVKYQKTFVIGDCQLASVGNKSYRKYEKYREYVVTFFQVLGCYCFYALVKVC